MREKVTVYIITLNRLSMLRRAIDSVISQTHSNLEIIVVDNGSNDGTKEYLSEIEKYDDRIVIISLSENKGACFARNRAIEVATGYYITGMDDDDYFHIDRIERLLMCYKSNINCAFVYSDDGYVKNGIQFATTKKPPIVDLEAIKYQNLVGNQVLSETSKYIEVGGFDESLKAAQDFDMWLRMLIKFDYAYKIDGVSQYVEAGDYSRISTSNNKFNGYMQFYRKHKHLFNRSQRKHQLLNIKYASRARITMKTYIILFDFSCIKRKIKVLLSRVIRHKNFEY